jgi:hypothetical protein
VKSEITSLLDSWVPDAEQNRSQYGCRYRKEFEVPNAEREFNLEARNALETNADLGIRSAEPQTKPSQK